MDSWLRIHRHAVHHRTAGTPPPAVDLAGELVALDLRGPPGVWLIDRLDVHVTVAPGGAAGRQLARQVARRLAQVLAAGAGHHGVRWFPDRAALVAQWLVDLCHGRAAGRWEYRQFGDRPAAVRELAQAEPATVATALTTLPAPDLDDLIEGLAPADAAAVTIGLNGESGAPLAEAVTVATGLRSLLDAGRLPGAPERAALAVRIALGEPTPAVTVDLARLLSDLWATSPGVREDLLRALAAGEWATAARLGVVAPALVALAAPDRAAVVAALAGPSSRPRGQTPSAGGPPDGEEPFHSEIGGAFLLLPLLACLPLAETTRDWPPLPPSSAEAVAGLLTIAGALGPARLAAVLADPWLRLAFGLPELTEAGVAAWSAGREEAIEHTSAALLRELAARLPGMAAASPVHLRRGVLDMDATIRPEPARIIVELGRPPLGVLLSLTGLDRRTFALPATGARTWLLAPRT